MRKFGTDAPEFLEFQLGEGDEIYRLPLAASMPMEKMVGLQEAVNKGQAESLRYQLDLLRGYIGDAADALTAGDMTAIFTAWSEESAKQGATPGE